MCSSIFGTAWVRFRFDKHLQTKLYLMRELPIRWASEPEKPKKMSFKAFLWVALTVAVLIFCLVTIALS